MTKFDRNVHFFLLTQLVGLGHTKANYTLILICSDFDKIIIPAKAGLVRCTHLEIYKGSGFTIL